MDDIVFLSWEDVLFLHTMQLELFGGQDGFIDQGVVKSAIAQPRQTMFGRYLHEDLAHMAAAYLFHLATTQGFMDGNKRTALHCSLTFLEVNGYDIDIPHESVELYNVALSVAVGKLDKEQLTEWFREHMQPLAD